MNRQHLQAFVWLRWRLLLNQARRGGTVNAVLTLIVAIGLVVMAIPLFIACFVTGLLLAPQATPMQLLVAADGLVLGFAFFWIIGLVTELQRTDTLSLSKFLHLPLSVSGVFFVNYFSSLVCLRLIVCVPILLGFALSLAFAKGWVMLAALPLTVAFLLMVTALTSQFQGWLASMMTNPRRRRTVIVTVTAIFVLIFQLPNLLNLYRPWGAAQDQLAQSVRLTEELAAIDREFQSQQFDHKEYVQKRQEIVDKHQLAMNQATVESANTWQRVAWFVNVVLPIGWLPLGVMAAAEGNIGPAFLGFFGMTLIGAASLWRAYRTTIRLYQGEFTSRHAPSAPAVARPARVRKPGDRQALEATLPCFSEPVSVIALAGLRSLVRAPEAKMMLLTPVIFVVAFGSIVSKLPRDGSEATRPLLAIGAIGLALFGVLQLMSNQFGFDRDGFRVFVLCAASRRDVLLGKNLSFAPLALAMAAMLLTIIEVFRPLRLEHFLSMAPQFVSMYLLFCLLTNLISIYAAVPIAAGSLKPANPKMLPVLLQLVMFTFLFPLCQAPTLAPLGIERLLESRGWTAGVPICLLLSLAECVAVVFVYRFALNWQGLLLVAREQRILETVTNRGI